MPSAHRPCKVLPEPIALYCCPLACKRTERRREQCACSAKAHSFMRKRAHRTHALAHGGAVMAAPDDLDAVQTGAACFRRQVAVSCVHDGDASEGVGDRPVLAGYVTGESHARTHAHTRTNEHTHTPMHAHARTHTRTHTHTHAQTIRWYFEYLWSAGAGQASRRERPNRESVKG